MNIQSIHEMISLRSVSVKRLISIDVPLWKTAYLTTIAL